MVNHVLLMLAVFVTLRRCHLEDPTTGGSNLNIQAPSLATENVEEPRVDDRASSVIIDRPISMSPLPKPENSNGRTIGSATVPIVKAENAEGKVEVDKGGASEAIFDRRISVPKSTEAYISKFDCCDDCDCCLSSVGIPCGGCLGCCGSTC